MGPRRAARLAPFAALALAGAVAAAPRPGLARSRPAYGGELHLALPALPRTADPALAAAPADLMAAHALHATPLERGPGGALRPGLLAELPEPSPDGRTFRLTLREGLRFADGTPLGAADLAASLTRLARPEVASPHAWLVRPIAGCAEVLEGRATALRGLQILSDRQLLVTLEFPFPEWPSALAALPAAVVSSSGAGAGPFRPEVAGGLERLVASEHHHRGRAFADALVLSAPDARAVVKGLEAGELDLALRTEPLPGGPAGAREQPQREVMLAAVNGRRLGAGAAVVRRALQALDRAELLRRFVRAQAAPQATLLPWPFPGAATSGATVVPAVGAAPGGSAASAAPERLVILVPAWLPDARAVAERLQVKLFDAGLRVALEPAEPARHAARLAAGDYHVAVLSVALLSTSPPLAAGQLALAVAGPGGALRAERALAGLSGEAAATAAEALRVELDLWPLYAAGLRLAVRPGVVSAGWTEDGSLDPGDLWRDPAPPRPEPAP